MITNRTQADETQPNETHTDSSADISDPEFRQLLAERIRALGDATRIHILHLLMSGEFSVTAIAKEAGKSQATISKHLSLLHRHGIVKQRKEGVVTYYSINNGEALQTFCHFMCGSLKQHLNEMNRFG